METWLEQAFSGVTSLNLGTPEAVAEASAHIGWGIAVLALAYIARGWSGLRVAARVLILYGLAKEYLEDGHLYRMASGTESISEQIDLTTDLLTRELIPASILLLCLIRDSANLEKVQNRKD